MKYVLISVPFLIALALFTSLGLVHGSQSFEIDDVKVVVYVDDEHYF